MMQIHERIKVERLKKGWTEEEMAKELGIGRSTYQYWESTTPKVENISSAAKALGLPDDYFFVTKPDDEDFKILSASKTIGVNKKNKIKGESIKGQQVFVEAKDLTASFERIIEAKEQTIAEKEARRLEAKQWAERAESEKKDLFDMFKDYLKEILSNSNKTKDTLLALRTEIVAENREMMETLDQIAGNDPGTTAAKSGKVEIAHRVRNQNKGKKAGTSKRD